MKKFWFTVMWFWKNRSWQSTRQKYKQFDRDLARYMESGVKPW